MQLQLICYPSIFPHILLQLARSLSPSLLYTPHIFHHYLPYISQVYSYLHIRFYGQKSRGISCTAYTGCNTTCMHISAHTMQIYIIQCTIVINYTLYSVRYTVKVTIKHTIAEYVYCTVYNLSIYSHVYSVHRCIQFTLYSV